MQPLYPQPASPRPYRLTLFLAGVLWIMAASSFAERGAQGIVTRLNLPAFYELLHQAFLLFLLLWGFSFIHRIGTRTPANLRSSNALPARSTSFEEWQRGAALGWGILLLALLPMMLTGALHPGFYLQPHNWGAALLSIATLALYTLALEVTFRGFIFARLIDTIGSTAATILLSIAYAFLSGYRPNSTGLSILVTFFLGILFSLAYLRTRALWLGWGLHFAWNVSMAVLFGLPLAGYETYNSLVLTSVSGPDWLTGGGYGPEGAFLTILVLISATFVLEHITRTYAWNYTHAPIVAAGIPWDITPPPAHTAMETAAAAAPAPLVQILSSTPSASSTLPIIDEHLRRDPTSTRDD